jgi:hypothetical protein
MTNRPTTRAPLNAIVDDEEAASARSVARHRPAPQAPSAAQAAPTSAAARPRRSLNAPAGLRQLNVEIPNETYLMLASLKLTEQARDGRKVTLQNLVTIALEEFIARERAKHLHAG